jgi:DNA-binding beta-propeller fold protein YncE
MVRALTVQQNSLLPEKCIALIINELGVGFNMAKLVSIDSQTKKYVILISILMALLIALLLFYIMISKPPVSKEAPSQKEFKTLFSIYGFEGDLLRRPSGIALDDIGRIYVTDTGKRRLVVFDENGNYVSQYSENGTGKYKINDPLAVTVASDGSIFLLSKTLKKIVKYDAQFKPLKEINFSESPIAMTIHDRKLYVTTAGGVMIGDLDGNLITSFGTRGKGVGQFDLPGGIVVGPNGNIYVADSLNYRVQAFNKDGSPLWQYGKPIPAQNAMMYQGPDRKFGMPASIALDDNGKLYIVDGLSSELVVLNTKGKYLDTIGDVGHDDGFFYYPEGIAYAGNGKLVLADKFNDRIQIFQVPMSTPAVAKAFDWAPYTLWLLLPLGLLFFIRRPRLQVVAGSGFLSEALRNDMGDTLAQTFRTLVVTQETLDKVKNILPSKLQLVVKEVDQHKAENLAAKTGLTKEQASEILLAKSLKSKRVLLTSSKEIQREANKSNIATITYNEFVSSTPDQSVAGKVVEGSI